MIWGKAYSNNILLLPLNYGEILFIIDNENLQYNPESPLSFDINYVILIFSIFN